MQCYELNKITKIKCIFCKLNYNAIKECHLLYVREKKIKHTHHRKYWIVIILNFWNSLTVSFFIFFFLPLSSHSLFHSLEKWLYDALHLFWRFSLHYSTKTSIEVRNLFSKPNFTEWNGNMLALHFISQKSDVYYVLFSLSVVIDVIVVVVVRCYLFNFFYSLLHSDDSLHL